MIRYNNSSVFIGWVDFRNASAGVYYQVITTMGTLLLETNGKLIHQGLNSGFDFSNYQVLSRTNDAVAIWIDQRFGYGGYKIYYQILNPDGSLGMETNGRPITITAANSYDQFYFSAIVTPDDKIAIVWEENHRVKAQLIDATGNRLWTENGRFLTDSIPLQQRQPKISYENGAFYLGWSQLENVETIDGTHQYFRVFGQKIVNNQRCWGVDGIQITPDSETDNRFETKLDKILDRYFVWTRWGAAPETLGLLNTWIKLVNPDGTPALGWSESGISASDYSDYDLIQYLPDCVLTSAGLFVAWLDFRTDFIKTIYGQMISPQGEVLWNPTGVELTNNDSEADNFSLLGTNDEITLFWTNITASNNNVIKMQKFNLNGEPLLGENGYEVSSLGEMSTLNYAKPARFDNGGMLVSWEQAPYYNVEGTFGLSDIYYRYINPNGSLIGATSLNLTHTPDEQKRPKLAIVNNEAYLFWADSELYYQANDKCDEGPEEGYSLYAQKLSNEVVANDDEAVAHTQITLAQNYPNPFNPNTSISLNMPAKSKVSLTIYNEKGQKVKTLQSGMLDKGKHNFTWNGQDDNNNKVASGIYLYKLSGGNIHLVKKMLLLK
jgi:hypothetical protein